MVRPYLLITREGTGLQEKFREQFWDATAWSFQRVILVEAQKTRMPVKARLPLKTRLMRFCT